MICVIARSRQHHRWTRSSIWLTVLTNTDCKSYRKTAMIARKATLIGFHLGDVGVPGRQVHPRLVLDLRNLSDYSVETETANRKEGGRQGKVKEGER